MDAEPVGPIEPINSRKRMTFPRYALIVFVLMCFYNARAQNKIDEEFGVSDE